MQTDLKQMSYMMCLGNLNDSLAALRFLGLCRVGKESLEITDLVSLLALEQGTDTNY